MVFARINEGFTLEEAIEAEGEKGTAELLAQVEAEPGATETVEIKKSSSPARTRCCARSPARDRKASRTSSSVSSKSSTSSSSGAQAAGPVAGPAASGLLTLFARLRRSLFGLGYGAT